MFFINKNRSFYTFTHLCVFCRDTRRLLEKLVYVPSKDFPVTVVQVASWYLLRHLHAKNDLELMNVSTQLSHTYTGNLFVEIYIHWNTFPTMTSVETTLAHEYRNWNLKLLSSYFCAGRLLWSKLEYTCILSSFHSRSFWSMPKCMEIKDCWNFIHCLSLHPECCKSTMESFYNHVAMSLSTGSTHLKFSFISSLIWNHIKLDIIT